MSTTADGASPGEGHGDRSDPTTAVGLFYRLVSDKSCTLGALTLLCPFVTVIGLVILLLAESPTLSIISAVVTAASGAGTIGLVARLIRRGKSGATTESSAIQGGAPNRVEAGTDRADGITTDEPGPGICTAAGDDL